MLLKNKRCTHCKRRVEITERDYALACLGIDELVICQPCRREFTDLLRSIGIEESIWSKGFRRL